MADDSTRRTDHARLRRAATLRSVQIGDLRVTHVPDGASRIRPLPLFPETTEQDWTEDADHLDASGSLTISAGALLVEAGERALLIDAGLGPLSSTPPELDHPSVVEMHGGALLDNLRRLGRRPQDVEAIAVTHLHVEHVGWAGHLVPGQEDVAFTRAEHLLSATEWDGRRAGYGVTDAVLAAMAPRVRTVADGQEIFPGVHVLELPGHTPGQLGFTITSGDDHLIAFADVMHSPRQVAHPHWALVADDPQVALRSRRRVLDELADGPVIGFGAHFADVAFGRVERAGTAFTWQPLP